MVILGGTSRMISNVTCNPTIFGLFTHPIMHGTFAIVHIFKPNHDISIMLNCQKKSLLLEFVSI